MKSYEEFTHFCAGKLNSDLELLHTKRGEVVRKLVMYRFFLALMVIGVAGIMFVNEMLILQIENSTFLAIVAILFLIIYIIGFIFLYKHQRKIRQDFVHDFKTRIIMSIVSFFDDRLDYHPYKFISFEEFTGSGLINQSIQKYYGDDFVEGKIGETAIRFSEVHAFIEQQTSENKKIYIEVFGGIFFVGDFNKSFKGRTYILPDKIEKSFGRFAKYFQSLGKSHGQLVKLEDPEFEKEFVVYSDDQIEARYILSTSLMKRILDFKKKAKSDIMMAFKSSKIYIAIPIKGKLFEPKIFGKLIAEETLRKYYEDLNITVSTVNDLNLNLRIWGK